jgi:uncharacterized protein
MSGLTKLAVALVIIGGLNWLLVGLFDFNLVAALFGATSILSRGTYIVVGLAAIYCIKLLTYPTTRARVTDEFRRAA